MKKKLRKKSLLKKLIIGILGIILIVYGTVFVGHKFLFTLPYSNKPTVKAVSKDGMTFGAASIQQPKNFDEYINVLSSQLMNFQKNINVYWPETSLENQYLIAQNADDGAAVLLTPEGEVTKLSKNEFKSYGLSKPLKIEGQWAPFSANGIEGAFISVMPENLSNYYSFQKYEHLGTYDQFLSYSHELFHSVTQEKWDSSALDASTGNSERFDDIKARQTRMLLQQQLKKAVTLEGQEMEDSILLALRTYKTYQTENTKDYQESLIKDRLEGTAYYFELVSSLYAAYPEQVNTQEEMYKAIAILFDDDNPTYRNSGVLDEGYLIGGLSGILLDKVMIENKEDPVEWKKEIEKDSTQSPISLLEKRYEGKELPEQQTIPSEEEYKEWLSERDKLTPPPSTAATMFSLVYGILFK